MSTKRKKEDWQKETRARVQKEERNGKIKEKEHGKQTHFQKEKFYLFEKKKEKCTTLNRDKNEWLYRGKSISFLLEPASKLLGWISLAGLDVGWRLERLESRREILSVRSSLCCYIMKLAADI